MEDEIIQKIYKLTTELASQQQSNQELATGLTTQITDLKVKLLYAFFILLHLLCKRNMS